MNYEYKTIHVIMPDNIQKKLQRFARDGWRLVCTTTVPGFHGVWIHLEKEIL